MTWEVRQGDALESLRGLAPGSVQCCVTSPPYWGLRDYGTASWDGGDPTCAHKGRPKPRQDTTGAGVNHGRFAATRGTQPAKAIHSVPVRDVCSCGARRVDSQLGLEATPEEYVSSMVTVFRELRRVLREDATLWLNLGDSYCSTAPGTRMVGSKSKSVLLSRSARLDAQDEARAQPIRPPTPHGLKPKDLVGMPWRVAFALQADGWYLRADVIWAKRNCMPESVTDRPTKTHEYVFLLAKSERYYYDAEAVREPDAGTDHQRNILHRPEPSGGLMSPHAGIRKPDGRNGDGRNRRSVWTIATEPYPESHFAVMPQALVEPCVLAGSKPGDLVLDPFAGSGTVGVVSLRYGRHFIGLELNADYCTLARRRIAGPLFAAR